MKGLFIAAAGLVLLGAILAAVKYAARLIALGTAYKAKMVCSEVFVAGRDLHSVMAELDVDDLAALRIIGVSIDTAAKSTTASVYGFAESKACYRDDFGCALSWDEGRCASSEIGAREEQGGAKRPRLKGGRPLEPEVSSDADHPQLAAVLDEAFSNPDPAHPRRTRAVVIVHEGRIVAERYAADIGPDTPLLGWSMTKSVMNALVGILVEAGRISLDAPVPVDTWRSPGDPRGQITLDHLLHMSSGLKFDDDTTHLLADVTHMLLRTRDMAAFAAHKPLEAEPGTRWKYSSGSTLIVSGILRQVLGDEAYQRFPREALFEPLGMTGAVLEADASGTFVGSSFMYATARDWARLGLLYLQDGIWEGRRILPEGWVQYTRTPTPADRQGAYGAHFWLRVPEEYRGAVSAPPEDAFHAVGHEGQFVTIVPSHETVIVRLGKTRYPQGWKHDDFVVNVLAALRESP